MRVDFDVDDFALVWLTFDDTPVERSLRHRRAARGWTEQRHKRSHVVWPDIEQGTCARLVEKLGGGVEPLVSMADDEGARGGDVSNRPVIDKLTTGLKASAQESVRSATYREAALLGEGQDFLTLPKRRR